MIISFSHEKIWKEDGSEPTEHKPYFLIEDKPDIPILDQVIEISEPIEVDSWVDWDKRKKIRKVYIRHPSVTPRVSTEYYKLGYETYEQAVPYIHRVYADLEAQGKYPLDTKGEWITLNCLIYDIEVIDKEELMTCIGFGEFQIRLKSTVDLEKEEYDLEIEIPDTCEITQITADNRAEQLDNIYRPLADRLRKAHVIIGHNITGYDNDKVLKRFKPYSEFDDITVDRAYARGEAYFRGRKQEVTEFYPLSFDTLLVARTIWKGESDVGYGLKRLAEKFNLSPKDRVYERDFGGFSNWSNANPKCLKYNRDDIVETFGIFKMQCKAMFINMLNSGMSFQDIVQGSNGRMADHMSLVRGHDKIINAPMQHPDRIARALWAHFEGKLLSKKEIFDYFRDHVCDWSCLEKYHYVLGEESEEEKKKKSHDSPKRMYEKLIRFTKYGNEMPEYARYYPLLHTPWSRKEQNKDESKVCYNAIGGKTVDPTEPLVPVHNAKKGDAAAQYPTILKAKNIVSDSVRLAWKGETPDGWCWFTTIYHKEVLDLFEWRPASDFPFSDGTGYFIGYKQRGGEGLLSRALTGIIKSVGKYKHMPGWEDAYQKALKPMRNAMTHGVLLSLDSTCQQFNIAGCAIPTLGNEITTQMNQYIVDHGWKLLESDTDGTEFRKIRDDATPFEELIHDVEKYWTDKTHFPLVFEVENYPHKLFTGHKNYVSITEKGDVKLTGNTFHAADKPKIAERCMKKLMLDVLPRTNTAEEFISEIHKKAYPIVEGEFRNITNPDLVIISGIKPADTYNAEGRAERSKAIEVVLGRQIAESGGKMEFIVCEDRLPGTTGEKTTQEPLSYMWPREFVEEYSKRIDMSWYKDMVYSYIDTAFRLSISSRHQLQSIMDYEDEKSEKSVQTQSQLFTYEDDKDKDKTEDKKEEHRQETLW